MDPLALILFLMIGMVAGWLASQIMGSGGLGPVGDVVVGVIGAFIGGWLFALAGVAVEGLVGKFITAVIGAIVPLAIIRVVKRV